MSLGTPKTQTAYLALLGEVLQQPGHHYIYHNETQYKTEQRFSIMSDIGAGFTARAFYYNKDNRGTSDISIYYKSGAEAWYMEMNYEKGKVSAIHRKRVKGSTESPDIQIANDSFYSFAVRCKDEEFMEGYLNKHLLHTGSVEKIPGYTWQLTLQNEHQKLLSVHLTFEEPPDTLKLSDYWGTKSYLENQWVPIGTVGVFECALVDKSAPHWLKITDSQGYEQQVEFQSGSLTQDSELCYNIRLSPVAYIVTTSFDYTSKTIYDSSGAYYIRVKFSPAVYIKRYDMKIPYFTPY
ncbi:uncharacterized protein [Dermacentor andersoni]|uniref:uncharacterized protein isoform X1 n=1 Tax=Dermacentor andersoni TaxID=34620 RepID=UPI00241728EE|nr:uncharacterized protein LOC129380717 isoform X1 [Dermacentor andersoni]